MIDPVTHVTQRKVVHLTHTCRVIWPGFNTGEDCCVCTTQAIGSSTLLNYYVGASSCALQPPIHQKSHVNIHQHSCKNIHNIVAASGYNFAFTSTTSYCIKSSYTHQQVVQATTMLLEYELLTSYHSSERLAWRVLTLWIIVLVCLCSMQNQ